MHFLLFLLTNINDLEGRGLAEILWPLLYNTTHVQKLLQLILAVASQLFLLNYLPKTSLQTLFLDHNLLSFLRQVLLRWHGHASHLSRVPSLVCLFALDYLGHFVRSWLKDHLPLLLFILVLDLQRWGTLESARTAAKLLRVEGVLEGSTIVKLVFNEMLLDWIDNFVSGVNVDRWWYNHLFTGTPLLFLVDLPLNVIKVLLVVNVLEGTREEHAGSTLLLMVTVPTGIRRPYLTFLQFNLLGKSKELVRFYRDNRILVLVWNRILKVLPLDMLIYFLLAAVQIIDMDLHAVHVESIDFLLIFLELILQGTNVGAHLMDGLFHLREGLLCDDLCVLDRSNLSSQSIVLGWIKWTLNLSTWVIRGDGGDSRFEKLLSRFYLTMDLIIRMT